MIRILLLFLLLPHLSSGQVTFRKPLLTFFSRIENDTSSDLQKFDLVVSDNRNMGICDVCRSPRHLLVSEEGYDIVLAFFMSIKKSEQIDNKKGYRLFYIEIIKDRCRGEFIKEVYDLSELIDILYSLEKQAMKYPENIRSEILNVCVSIKMSAFLIDTSK